MSDKLQQTLDAIFVSVGLTTGYASTLDNIEQIGRIVLLAISIFSGILLILVNWDKALARLKRFIK